MIIIVVVQKAPEKHVNLLLECEKEDGKRSFFYVLSTYK